MDRSHKIEPLPHEDGSTTCGVCGKTIWVEAFEVGPLVADLGPDGPDVRRRMKAFWRHL